MFKQARCSMQFIMASYGSAIAHLSWDLDVVKLSHIHFILHDVKGGNQLSSNVGKWMIKNPNLLSCHKGTSFIFSVDAGRWKTL